MFIVYFLVLGAVTAGTLLSGKYVAGHSEEELQIVFSGLLAGHAILLLLLCLFTRHRLRFRTEAKRHIPSTDTELRQWKLLTGFPKELLWFTFISSAAISQLYHFIVMGLPPWPRETAIAYTESTLSNLTTYFALGLIFYSTARWALRPYIIELRLYRHEGIRFKSAMWNFVTAAACGLIYVLLRLLRHAGTAHREGQSPDWTTTAAIGAIVSFVTLFVIYYMSRYLFRDVERLTAKLHELAGMRRRELMQHIPIGSPYEAGELTMAFNMLQRRFEQEYKRIDQDIRLAVQVQQQLLSNLPPAIGDWRFSGDCRRAMEVGGGFYDAIPLDSGRIAIVAGCVTGNGLPSALVMSSILMLLRTRMQDAATTGEWLTRLNQECMPIMQEEMRIHIGIGIIDHDRDTLHVAMAGRIQLQLEQQNGHLPVMASGAEPLGDKHSSSFSEDVYPLLEQCQITLRAIDSEDRSMKEEAIPAQGSDPLEADRSSLTAYRGGKENRHDGA